MDMICSESEEGQKGSWEQTRKGDIRMVPIKADGCEKAARNGKYGLSVGRIRRRC